MSYGRQLVCNGCGNTPIGNFRTHDGLIYCTGCPNTAALEPKFTNPDRRRSDDDIPGLSSSLIRNHHS